MFTRSLLSIFLGLVCFLEIGSAECWNCRYAGQSCASCGMCEASCACPDCGCADPCCDVSCGCPEPACGCVDECCDPCCGVPGCGSMVGGRRCFLGTCPLLVRLRNLFCGTGCGCCDGCSCETYCGDWSCDHACRTGCEPCDQCGNYTGAQYGMPMRRQSYVAERVRGDEIRFTNGAKSMRR